jgi:hypothetical protein
MKYRYEKHIIDKIAGILHDDHEPRDNKEYCPVIVTGDDKCKDVMGDEKHDRRVCFIDSSIWIRYANSDEMSDIKKEFEDYHKLELYKTSRAIENREFMSRLCKNSYLKAEEGGHGGVVAPFLFHSETEMKKQADKLKERLHVIARKDSDKKIVWRMLLVDDQATEDAADEA